MTIAQLYKKIKPREIKISNQPFVLLPLESWYDLEDILLEMSSPKLQKEIAAARQEIAEGKGIPYRTLRKEIGLA